MLDQSALYGVALSGTLPGGQVMPCKRHAIHSIDFEREEKLWHRVWLYQPSSKPPGAVNMYISSPGGSVAAGLAIYDTMRHLSCPIATTCVGYAASFGTILLMAGDHGRRRALPHARIHIHQPWIQSGIGGQVTDIDIHARELLHTRDVLNEIIQQHTGQPLERIRHDTERDFFMSAREAVEYGIVDEVLTLAEK